MAIGIGVLLASVACRDDPARIRNQSTSASAAVAPSSAPAIATPPPPASVPTWRGKRLHLWVTTCDTQAREFRELRAAIDAHPTMIDAVGIACQTLLNDDHTRTPSAPLGAFATVGEGTRGKGDRAALAAQLHARHVATTLLVANPGTIGFDGALGKRVLENEGARRRLVDQLDSVFRREKHRAIELDLEGMPTAAAADYVKLAQEVAVRTGAPPVVDVHPKTVDDPGWDGPGAHDYAALARTGAIVRLMTYDFSIGPVPPGPSTRASWIRDVVAYARTKGVPAAQLEVGLPAYGYDFPPTAAGPAVPLQHREVLALLGKTKAKIERTAEGAPHFAYDGPGGRHEVWFDDAESLQRVLEDLRPIAPEVRGIAIWGVSGGDPALMAMLERTGFRRSAD